MPKYQKFSPKLESEFGEGFGNLEIYMENKHQLIDNQILDLTRTFRFIFIKCDTELSYSTQLSYYIK